MGRFGASVSRQMANFMLQGARMVQSRCGRTALVHMGYGDLMNRRMSDWQQHKTKRYRQGSATTSSRCTNSGSVRTSDSNQHLKRCRSPIPPIFWVWELRPCWTRSLHPTSPIVKLWNPFEPGIFPNVTNFHYYGSYLPLWPSHERRFVLNDMSVNTYLTLSDAQSHEIGRWHWSTW